MNRREPHRLFHQEPHPPLIHDDLEEALYDYIGGILRGQRGILLEIGGMPDHVRILARFGAAIAVSEMLKRIKGSSSHWLSQETGTWFAWQSGYGAFSVSESQVAAVRKYIQQQEEHHKRITFKDELISLLRKHRIEFDEGDLLD